MNDKCIINMYSNNEFIKIDIINCMSYHFDEIIQIEGFNFDVLIDEKMIRKYFSLSYFIKKFDRCQTFAY